MLVIYDVLHSVFHTRYYLVKAPLLISYRIYSYFQDRCQYFLIDFCYWANLLLLIQIVFFPTNKRLFMVAYAVSHGPLIWAVGLFKNALVFHSVDKTISAFIHISPYMVSIASLCTRVALLSTAHKGHNAMLMFSNTDTENVNDEYMLTDRCAMLFAGSMRSTPPITALMCVTPMTMTAPRFYGLQGSLCCFTSPGWRRMVSSLL